MTEHLVQASISVEEGSRDVAMAAREAPELVDKAQEVLDNLRRVTVLLEKAMREVPEISKQAREGMRDVNRILDAVKENWLIRSNLPSPNPPESHGVEIRGGQD